MNDGGPAFPVMFASKGKGMSLRDWFAGCALQGLLAADYRHKSSEPVAGLAYEYADTMLAKRSAPGPSDAGSPE